MYRLKKCTIIFALFAGLVPSIIGAVESPSFEEALKALCTQYGRPIDENTFKTFLENHAPETQKTSETSEKSLVPFETIEILSYNPKETEDVPQNITSVYQDCFGEGRLFRIVSEEERQDEWREEAITKMQGFGEALRNLGVKQNPLIASFSFFFSENHQTRVTLPRVFFSGTDQDLKKSIALEPMQSFLSDLKIANLDRLDFIIKPLIVERSLKRVVDSCFENKETSLFFYKPFPESKGHSVIFTQVGKGDGKKSKKQQRKKRDDSAGEVACVPQLPETDIQSGKYLDAQSVLDFKSFVLTHFMSDSETEFKDFSRIFTSYEEKLKETHQYKTNYHHPKSTDISRDKLEIPEQNESNITLMKMYIEQKKGDLLRAIFGQKDDFNLFSLCTDEGNNGMAYCFHQSEQAFLRYVLGEEDKEIAKSQFSKELEETIGYYIMENIETLLKGNAIIVKSSQEEIKENIISTRTTLPSSHELQKSTSPQDKKKTRQKSTSSQHREKTRKEPSSIILEATIPRITLDLISEKHICVFCRGTISVRHKALFEKLQSAISNIKLSKQQNKYEKRFQDFLTALQENLSQDNVEMGKEDIEKELKNLSQDSVIELRVIMSNEDDSKNQKLKVFASSYQNIENTHLMGKKNIEKEVSHENLS